MLWDERLAKSVTEMKWILIFVILVILAIEDVRERQIRIIWIVGMAVVAMLDMLLNVSAYKIVDVFAGLLPGSVLVILSLIFPKHIGCGDGLVLLALGGLLGLADTLVVFFVSTLVAAGMALVICVLNRNSREILLPNIVFYLLGYMVFMVIKTKGAGLGVL